MSSEGGSARERAERREEERQRLRDERKAEAAKARRKRSDPLADEPDDPSDPLAAERRIWRDKQRAKKAAAGETADEDADVPPSREDQLIQHAKKLQEENKSTLKNTIKVARETTVVGAQTIHKLNEQTEQFHRMDNNLDDTNDSLTRSERVLRGMKSIGGTIANMFTSGKKQKKIGEGDGKIADGDETTTKELDQKDAARRRMKEIDEDAARSGIGSASSPAAADLRASRTRGSGADESDLDQLTNGRTVVAPNGKQQRAIDVLSKGQKDEDDALDELSDVLGTLKEQSVVMGTQLKQQSKILDNLGDKVDGTSERLKKGSRTMAKIT